jgi:NADH:ubiquinone oxidoreductase subunit H
LMSLVVVFLFFRSSYPRMRYDVLMTIIWKNILLVVIIIYLFFFVIGV